jgi:hypothetical protein
MTIRSMQATRNQELLLGNMDTALQLTREIHKMMEAEKYVNKLRLSKIVTGIQAASGNDQGLCRQRGND